VEIRTAITAASKRKPARNLAGMSPNDALDHWEGDGQRLALDWRPLLHWTEADVWRACGTSLDEVELRRMLYKDGYKTEALDGWIGHPAYVFGNRRLSCALCILARESDMVNGANHVVDLYTAYLELERRGGKTFKNGFSLADLPELEGAALAARDEHRRLLAGFIPLPVLTEALT
jgi:hypothetical protein